MKNFIAKLLTILATLAVAFSFTVSQASMLPDLPTLPTEIVHPEESEIVPENREPDYGINCEDDYNDTNPENF
ncbi:MAG: hypothetical protein LIO49_02035 [Ruminococcus sp.]|nr:hypothetical protein [Ruminococcus sp.]